MVTCLESFADVEYANYEVVVVDNASADGTGATGRERYPSATLIVNADNLGCVGEGRLTRRLLISELVEQLANTGKADDLLDPLGVPRVFPLAERARVQLLERPVERAVPAFAGMRVPVEHFR